jgi:hypothetical protein
MATFDTGLAERSHADFGSSQRFVLIHGAWHGGFAWDNVASRLKEAGTRSRRRRYQG